MESEIVPCRPVSSNGSAKFPLDEQYCRRYEVYLEKSHQIELCLEIFTAYLPELMKHLSVQSDVLNVLSVGSGDGTMDRELVKIFQRISQRNIHNKVIEPNKNSFAKYKESINNQHSSELDQVVFNLVKPQSFQDYMVEQKTDPVKFDVVHFVHSIYYIDFEEALNHCYNEQLGENGIILCILAANEVMCDIKKKLFNLDQSMASKGIIDVINKHGWKFQHHITKSFIDVTEVFDDRSETGNLLLDFLTHIYNFRATMDEQIVEEIIQVIKRRSEYVDGKQVFKKDDHYIFIFK